MGRSDRTGWGGEREGKDIPSAQDVSFADKQRLSSHMVYTPHLVVQISTAPGPAELVIANPDFANRLSELDQDGVTAVSRGCLNFQITDAQFVMAKGKGFPLCQLDAFMDDVLFCTLTNVLTTLKSRLAEVEKAPDGTFAGRTPNDPTDTVMALDTLDLTHATVTNSPTAGARPMIIT